VPYGREEFYAALQSNPISKIGETKPIPDTGQSAAAPSRDYGVRI